MTNILIASHHKRNWKLKPFIEEKIEGINVLNVCSRDELKQMNLKALDPEWIFFPHWSWIIPPEIYESYNCVIFHMTDLPYGRGGSPLQNLIVRGHEKTKICALKCEQGLDTGPVFCRRELTLEGSAEEILRRANECIRDMIIHIILQAPEPIEQLGETTLFERRKPEEGDLIDLKNNKQVYDYIRMLDADDYPNAFLETTNHVYSFSDVKKEGDRLIASVSIKQKDKYV
jgi:methionyl-tRNA formyltransferase